MNEQPDFRSLAEMMLRTERAMRPRHHPPSTGIILTWRNELRVGMVQHPIDIDFPLIVFLSITSKYRDPEYARHVRNMDPGRLELTADPRLDMEGNFHVLRRIEKVLTFMTPEETHAMERSAFSRFIVQVQPREDGSVELIPVGTEGKFQQEPPMPSEKIQ